MAGPYRGSCLCGAITFEATAFADSGGHCHCSMCRKFHGAAYATLASVNRDAFCWKTGEELLTHFTAPNGTTRSFCSRCGSSLQFTSPRANAAIVEIALATFDDELPIQPSAHIFVASGANWVRLPADERQFAEGRASEQLAGPGAE